MEMNERQLHELLDRMAENWPSEFVARKKVGEFTGYMLDGKSVANQESKGEGPPKIRYGRNAGYPKWPFVEWLKTRMFVPSQKNSGRTGSVA